MLMKIVGFVLGYAIVLFVSALAGYAAHPHEKEKAYLVAWLTAMAAFAISCAKNM